MSSLLLTVVSASRCRSTHHRLAVDALRHLRSEDAEDWQNLILHHHKEYLEGAKAPDDEFKDFKNHVLHVRDGDWGGAAEACEEWYRRTVTALKNKEWDQAAWCAGVMSHYYVDPLQPFHTHQTEEEGVIHRAVEWSFNKSYKTFVAMNEAAGYPDIEVPTTPNWLAEMVRAGACASNLHYETIIEHYDFAKGVKDPPAGLDQELKNVIAPLIAHATVGLARIWDRAIEEAGVEPAKVGGALQAVFLTMEMPIQAVLKGIDDAAARKEVEAQFEEFRRTGKVRTTLGEDDKVVRALYATEVLKMPLSSLDAKWPRETGAKAGKKEEPKALPKPKTPRAALPEGAPLAKKDKTTPKFMLDGDAPVEKAPSIGVKTAKRLEAVGVKTVADLLACSPDDAQKEIGARHISAQVIRDWQSQALLACTVPGLKSREAQALVACGVRDAQMLATSDAAHLCEQVAEWGLSEDGARAWGSAAAPTPDDVATWIERAKRANRPANDIAA